MPAFELWFEHSLGLHSLTGMFDCVAELDEIRAALNEPVEKFKVCILDQGVPSNYLPALESLPLSEMLERGNGCGCGCYRLGKSFCRVLDD